jgi:hypothetical protein
MGPLRNLDGCPTGQRSIVSVCRVTSRATPPLVSSHLAPHFTSPLRALTRKCSATLVAQPPDLPTFAARFAGRVARDVYAQ